MKTEFYIQQKQWNGSTYDMVTIATATEVEYHGEWMGEEYVLVTAKSPTPVDFHLGDVLSYRGEQFCLMDDPNVVKNAGSGKYGEGFTYSNIKLYSVGHYMHGADFKDVVLDDNKVAYTSLSEFSFFAESVEDLADRLQANLNRFGEEHDSATWRVFTPNKSRFKQRFGIESDRDPWVAEWEAYYPNTSGTTIGETDVNISVTKEQGCWELLQMAYSQFGLSFYQREYDIVIGAPEVRPGHIFRYGKGNGLAEIERTSDESQELVTKVWGYGSETNMPTNYYANMFKHCQSRVMIAEKIQIFNDLYHFRYYTPIEYSYVSNLFNKEGQVTLKYGNLKCVAHGMTISFDGNPSRPPTWAQANTPYLCFVSMTHQSNTPIDGTWSEVNGFYNAVSSGITSATPDGVMLNVDDVTNADKWPTNLKIAMSGGYQITVADVVTDGEYPTMLSINRLMLPGFPKMSLDDWLAGVGNGSITGADAGGLTQGDARYLRGKYDFSDDPYDPWVKSKNAETVGSIEGSAFFDGGSQQEIMPTIENTSAGVVNTGSDIEDNGFISQDGNFTIKVAHVTSLNWKDALNDAPDRDAVEISMKSGYCSGKPFKVNKATEAGDYSYWELELARYKDSSLNRYFPYHDSDVSGYCQIRATDTFVVTGIQMPDSYVIAASVKLLLATCGWLDKRDHIRYTYVPKIDEIYMAREHASAETGTSLHDTLKAGMQLQIEDSDLGIERYTSGIHTSPFIDVLTIKEGSSPQPTYDVVLRDEKEKGALEKMADSMQAIRDNVRPKTTERQRREVEYVEYTSWSPLADYYYETLNVDENRLETSRVLHHGVWWECRRTFTHEEPHYGCADWSVMDGSEPVLVIEKCKVKGNITPNSTIASGESMHVTAYVKFGDENVGSEVDVVTRDDGWELPSARMLNSAILTVKWKEDNGQEAMIAFTLPYDDSYFDNVSSEVTLLYNGVMCEQAVMRAAGDGSMYIDLNDQSVQHPEWFNTIHVGDRLEFTNGFDYTAVPSYVRGTRITIGYDDCFVTGRGIGPDEVLPINPDPSEFTVSAEILLDGAELEGSLTLVAAKKSIKDMGEWDAEEEYKPMFDRDDDLAERVTPAVWYQGILWELTSLEGTEEEPGWSSDDWVAIGGDMMPAYEVIPSHSVLYCTRTSNVLSNPPALSLSVLRNDNTSVTDVTVFSAAGVIEDLGNTYYVRYSMSAMPATHSGGTAWPTANSVQASTTDDNVFIALFDASDNLIDSKTVAIVKDGADGDGIVSITRTYAISATGTSASDSTYPSDITSWSAGSPSVTVAKPYLWVKEITVFTDTTKNTTKYFCIGSRGENGIDAQDVEWAYIRTTTNTAPVILNDSSYTDSNGKTYTSDGHLPHVSGNANIENNEGSYECTDDPKGVSETWHYEWEIKRRKGAAVVSTGSRTWAAYSGTMTLHNNFAESAFIIDIDNDSDQFGTDSDSKVLADQTRSTTVTLYDGATAQTLTALSATLTYEDGTSVPSSVATVTATYGTGVVAVTVLQNNTSNSHTEIMTNISATCAKGTKTIVFSLRKVMSGAPGLSPVIYQLAPTNATFPFSRDSLNNLTPNSRSTQVNVARTEGSTTTILSTAQTGITYSWGFDESATAQASGRAVGTTISVTNTQAASHYQVWVSLSTGDRDTLPIVKDGANGASITRSGDDTYRYATNNTGTRPAASSSSWSTTKPTLQQGYWLYTETTIHWSDNSTTVLYTDERNPDDGEAGLDIVAGTTTVKYYVGTSNTTHPAENSSDWKDLDQVTQTQGKWLWSQSKTPYYKGTVGGTSAGQSVTYNVSYIAKDGSTGRGISSISEYYKASANASDETAPSDDSGWTTNPNTAMQSWNATNKYLWNYEKISYSSGTPSVTRSTPSVIAIWTEDGDAGRGIDSITNYYKISTKDGSSAANSETRPSTDGTDGWSSTPVAPTAEKPYLWNYEKISWVNPAGTTYTDPQMIGHYGRDGEPGGNTATVYLYKRSATAITSIGFTTQLTYTFATKLLSSTPNNWSQTVPSGTDPIYVTAATAYSTTATDTIAYTEWAAPVLLSENGTDGLNSASVWLYQRGATAPSKPSSALTYTFATGVLSGTLGNWSQTVPSTDGNPCWVIQATAIATTATDTINASEWSEQRKLVEDGEDGTSPWVADLDNEMDSIICNTDGKVVEQQSVVTNLSMYYGATKKTFKVQSVTKNGSSSMGTGVTVSHSPAASTASNAHSVTVTYANTATISGKDDFAITLRATDDSGNNIDRVLHFVVNAVTDEVYNLYPSASEIVAERNSDGTFQLTGIKCGYTKKAIDGTITTVSDVTDTHTTEPSGGYPLYVDGRYNIWYHRRLRSTGEWEKSGSYFSFSAYNYSTNRTAIVSGFDPNTYDAVEFLLCTEVGNGRNRTENTLPGTVDREIVNVVANGMDGAPGAPGGNTATVYLYKRSASAITSVGISATLYYKFSTKKLYTNSACTTEATTQLNSWSLTIPSGTNPIYVTAAIAYSTTASDDIASSEWVTPAQFTENGEHGVNTAAVFLYKRSETTISSHGISSALYYKFANGKLYTTSACTTEATTQLNGWSLTIPASDGNPCYVIQAAALSTDTYDQIATGDWSSVRKLVEDGADGISGIYLSAHDTSWGRNNSGSTVPSSWGSTVLTPTASERYVWRKDEYIYDAPEYGRNLMRGTAGLGILDNVTTSWANGCVYNSQWSSGSGTLTVDTSQTLPIDGLTSAIKITTTTAGWGFAQGQRPLTAGKKITLSCWVKGTSGNSVALMAAWLSSSVYTGNVTFTCNGEWQHISTTGTVPSTSSEWRIGYVRLASANATLYVCGVKVEYGEAATDWTPAPEDLNVTETSVWSIYGESPIFADLDNEMDSVACNVSGVTTGGEQYVETNAHLWKGTTAQTISSITCKIGSTTLGTSYSSSTSSVAYYYKVSTTPSTGYVKVFVREGATITSKTEVTVTISATIDGASVSRSLTLTINGARAGSEGTPASIFRIMPSVDVIKRDKSGTLTPTSITCSVQNTIGSNVYTATSSDGTLRYNIDADITSSSQGSTMAIGGSVSYNSTNTFITFAFYKGTTLLDKERVPIVYDGVDGTSPWVADLNNEMDSVSCDDLGHPLASTSVSTAISLYCGSTGKNFKITGITKNGSSTLGTGVTVSPTASTTSRSTPTTFTVTYATTATISGKDDFAITIQAVDDSTITRTLHFTVNAVIGDVYNVYPAVSEIVAHEDGNGTIWVTEGITSIYTLHCGYTKNANGTITTVAEETSGTVDSKYPMFYRKHHRSENAWATWQSGTGVNYDGVGTPYYERFYSGTSTVDVNIFDAVSFIITPDGSSYTGGFSRDGITIIDQEIVHVVTGGTGDTVRTVQVYKRSDTLPGVKPSATTITESTIDFGNGWWLYALPEKFTLDSAGNSSNNCKTFGFTAPAANSSVTVKVTASSEANYDFGAVGKVDATALASATASSIKSDSGTMCAAKASGTTTATASFTGISAGNHFIQVAYAKDGSTASNNDNATFEVSGNIGKNVYMCSATFTDGAITGGWTEAQQINGEDGEDAWVASLDNVADSVSCDDMGNIITAQSVSTAISLYYGTAAKSFKITSITRNGSSSMGTGVTVSPTASTTSRNTPYTFTVSYSTTAQISNANARDDFAITIKASDDDNITRTLHLTINGAKGDVYNLYPGSSEIVATRNANGTFNTTGIICGYTRKESDGSITTVDDVPETHHTLTTYPLYVEGKYNIWYHRRLRSTGDWERSSTNYYFSAYNYDDARTTIVNNFDPNTYDAVEFLLCTEVGNARLRGINTMLGTIDRVIIPVTAEGEKGDQGKMGRNLWYAGVWSSFTGTFTVTDHQAPYFEVSGSPSTYWAFVGENGTWSRTSVSGATQAGDPSASNANWEQMTTQFKYLISEAVFSNFAKFGGSVFNGDYQFSQYGDMRGFGGLMTEITNGTQFQYVDPNDMFGESDLMASGLIWNNNQSYTVSSTSWTSVGSLSFSGSSGRWYTIMIGGSLSALTQVCAVDAALTWRIANSGGTAIISGQIGSCNPANALRNSNVFNFYISSGATYYLQAKVSNSTNYRGFINIVRMRLCEFVPKYVIDTKSGRTKVGQLSANDVRYNMSLATSSTTSLKVDHQDIINVESGSSTLSIVLPAVSASLEGRHIEVINPSGRNVSYSWERNNEMFDTSGQSTVVYPEFSYASGSNFALPYGTAVTVKQVRFLCHNSSWYVIWMSSSIAPHSAVL